MLILTILSTIMLILVSVAFANLIEQKVLSYIRIRKGPKKVGFLVTFF